MLSIVVAIKVLSVLIAPECSAIFILRFCGIGSGEERSNAPADAIMPGKICPLARNAVSLPYRRLRRVAAKGEEQQWRSLAGLCSNTLDASAEPAPLTWP